MNWHKTFGKRVLWYYHVVHNLKEVAWPNQRRLVMEELQREPELSQAMISEFVRDAKAQVKLTRDEMKKHGVRRIPIGRFYWSDEALWKLRTFSAEKRMALACKEEVVAGEGGEALCEDEKEVRIEEGALAIASVFNNDLDALEIPKLLDELSEELEARFSMMAAVKRGTLHGQRSESTPSCCREELLPTEQIAALNSLMFNEPRAREEYSPEEEDFGLLPQYTASRLSDEDAIQRLDLEDLVVGWPGLGLKGNRRDYYNSENSLIDKILGDSRKGIPISLAVVYGAVGRRAGLPIRMINAPGHFVVSLGNKLFMDVFEGGKLRTMEGLVSLLQPLGSDERKINKFMRCASPSEINLRLCMNLVHIFADSRDYDSLLPIIRLAMTIRPNHPDLIIQYAKVQAMFEEYDIAIESLGRLEKIAGETRGFCSNIFSTNIADHCRRFVQHFQMTKMLYLKQCTLRRYRPKGGQILFRVGQIINHKRYNYRGVIYGWDPKCEAGEKWIEQMGVDELHDGRDQPFYKVLVDCRDRNTQSTYVAQENVEVEKDRRRGMNQNRGKMQVEHPLVGKYFESYQYESWHVDGQHYLPNAFLLSQYPED